jgi:hypothetical protein
MLVRIPTFLTLGSFRPRVHPKLVQQNPKALKNQSLARDEKGLTRDAKRIIETIRYCVRDEGLNILNINEIDIHVNQI